MGRIFCLMGKSSSGKDTVFKELVGDKDLNLKPVIPYTTRPKRNSEVNGVNYFFIDEKTLNSYIQSGKVIEKREYNTVNGVWHYCTIDDGQISLDQNYILIATLEAYKSLRAYFGPSNVVALYITVEDGIRLERALKRERQQALPNYDELCRRFLADNRDFSDENLTDLGIYKYYSNDNFSECIRIVKDEIFKILNLNS